MTKMTTLAALSAACAALSACGGSGDSPAPPPPAPAPAAPQVYNYVAPTLGETDVWTQVLTDNLGNAVPMEIRQRVTAVHDDGTMQFTFDDPTGVDVVEDGVTFRVTPEVADVAANGSTIDYTNTAVDGTQTTCVYGNPSSATAAARVAQSLALRHPDSLYVGQTWTTTYTIACGTQAPVTYTSTGSVGAMESVAVGAGVFQALRETVSITYTVGGIDYRTDETLWRDPARSLFAVMIENSYWRSDTSHPYIAHLLRQLSSRS
jgi:hypothetical protein